MRAYLDGAAQLTGVGWAGLPLDSLGFLVSRLDPEGRWLIVVDEPDRADQVERAARFFHPRPEVVERFMADDGRVYDGFSPERTRAQRRIRALRRVSVGGPCVIVASARALLQNIPAPAVLAQGTRTVSVGDTLDRDALVGWLTDAGYLSTQTAEMAGAFAVRGDVVDIWPSAMTAPVRLDFFDDEIEGIRTLDAQSGRPVGPRKRVVLLPAREERVDDAALDRLQAELGRQVTAQQRGIRLKRRVVEELRAGIRFSALEDWLPALVPTVGPLAVLGELRAVVYEPGDVLAAGREFLRTARSRWEGLEEDERPLVPPEDRFSPIAGLEQWVEGSQKVWQIAADGAARFEVTSAEGYGVRGTDLAPVASKLVKLMGRDCRVALVVDSASRGDALEQLLGPHGITPGGAADALAVERGKITMLVGDLPRGFVAADSGWAFIPAHVLLGGTSRAKRTRLDRIHALFETEVTDIAQLKVDDHVVHRLHGVGLYKGLKRVPIGGVKTDFVRLEYRGGDTMFLPVTRLGQLSRYTPANSNATVKLDRLGGATWVRRKGKVRDSLLKMAHDLLRLYARRELATRKPYEPAGALYRQMEARFPYDETVDQLKAIEAVHEDLDRPFPMDRLLCGDVGFGKTEVALRAAMRVVESGKQVSILCPTTVLAFQHYNTWSERFEGLPVQVRMLSRFNSLDEERQVLAGLRSGEVDIVVGTTKLLGREVRFADLGMVVVDEEHRFGVRQKDRLKKMRAAIDVLSMSATPIPRTLQQALGGLREMSVMATPPSDRLSVATSITRLSESRVRDALVTELARGGQSFVIHNRVETIGRFASRLERWVPEARFGIAHGQMEDSQLEEVLVRFINREIDVLVCTAIVETGIDLPNVNTMLIHRADLFGLAQLYQLRGRVGRSHVRARCLLLTPEEMTPEAKKRLRVLVENTELGAGFQIASADLELRGGGNLLGSAQSGNIDKVGYEVWVELLDEAVAAARGEQSREQIDPEVEVGVDAFIPDKLLPEMRERLAWYSRLSNATSVSAIEQLLDDLELLVGDLPIEVRNLGGLLQARIRCKELGIQRCAWLKVRAALELHPNSPLDADTLERLVAKHPKRFRVKQREFTELDVRFTPSEAEKPFQYLLWVFTQLRLARDA